MRDINWGDIIDAIDDYNDTVNADCQRKRKPLFFINVKIKLTK